MTKIPDHKMLRNYNHTKQFFPKTNELIDPAYNDCALVNFAIRVADPLEYT